MRMSIDEAIKQLTTYSIPCGKYKNAYDMAIETMCKYQRIQAIVEAWKADTDIDSYDSMMDIYKVIEDGRID